MRLWIFSDFAVPSKAHIDQYAELGFSDIVLGVTTDRSRFRLNSTEKAWLTACERIHHHNMLPHFMVWAVRKKDFIEQAFEVLEPMMVKGVVGSLMFDAEGTWHQGRSMTPQAASNLIKKCAGDREIGVTGLDRLHSTVAPLAKVCDYILPQAYSCWKPSSLCDGKRHWSHSAHTFPGVQQRRAYESWGLTNPTKDFVMGLACYWGDRPKSAKFPGMTDIQSMRFAMTETIAVWYDIDAKLQKTPAKAGKFRGAAYWSGKHLRGKTPTKKLRREFMQLAMEA